MEKIPSVTSLIFHGVLVQQAGLETLKKLFRTLPTLQHLGLHGLRYSLPTERNGDSLLWSPPHLPRSLSVTSDFRPLAGATEFGYHAFAPYFEDVEKSKLLRELSLGIIGSPQYVDDYEAAIGVRATSVYDGERDSHRRLKKLTLTFDEHDPRSLNGDEYREMVEAVKKYYPAEDVRIVVKGFTVGDTDASWLIDRLCLHRFHPGSRSTDFVLVIGDRDNSSDTNTLLQTRNEVTRCCAPFIFLMWSANPFRAKDHPRIIVDLSALRGEYSNVDLPPCHDARPCVWKPDWDSIEIPRIRERHGVKGRQPMEIKEEMKEWADAGVFCYIPPDRKG